MQSIESQESGFVQLKKTWGPVCAECGEEATLVRRHLLSAWSDRKGALLEQGAKTSKTGEQIDLLDCGVRISPVAQPELMASAVCC